MSTAGVRTGGSAEEKHATSEDAEHADGRLGARGEEDEGSRGGEAVQAAAGTADEAGAWDDGLIARRARGAAPAGERQSWARDQELWDAGSGSRAEAALGAAGESGWEPAGAAVPAERRAAVSESQGAPQDAPGRGGHEEQRPSEWPWDREPGVHGRTAGTYGDGGAQGRDENAQERRVAALRRLVDLSRSRIPAGILAEAQRVLDAAGARGRLPRAYTAVAIAGATGSGKSSLFNALAGTRLSQAGMRRPTTATPVACSWEVPGAGPADGLLDRLAVPPSTRRLMRPESDWRGRIDASARSELEGLVLIDLPDHDSAAEGHREQVERLLRLVDAVVWVVDPEKYADAVLHERYLRPLAGYAEVTFIVLNQTDRLPGEAKDAVLNDLRRLLDEDGMALGDHGEPGARVLATSALVGEGIDELRSEIGGFVAGRRAAVLRLGADLDAVVERLRPVYEIPGPGPAAYPPAGLTEEVREHFADQLARAAGAVTAGQAAERAWLRKAERACGTPWAQLQHWYDERRSGPSAGAGGASEAAGDAAGDAADDGAGYVAGDGGTHGSAGGSVDGRTAGGPAASGDPLPRVARPGVAHAVRTVVDQAAAGLPDAWRRSVRDAAWRGADGLPEALDEALRCEAAPGGAEGAGAPEDARSPRRPVWWALALVGQLGLLALQILGAVWVVATALEVRFGEEWMGVALLIGGVLGSSLLAWGCRFAARGPAAECGQREERRLRRVMAACGQVRVLEPVAAELLRYREVREQYVVVAAETRV